MKTRQSLGIAGILAVQACITASAPGAIKAFLETTAGGRDKAG